jgi:hypothetical protein
VSNNLIPMRFILTNIFIFLTCYSILGQANVQDSLIVTYAQNSKWLARLEEKNIEDKLAAIKTRILSDTAIYVRQAFPDRIKFEDQSQNEKRIQGDCKPVLVFGYQPVYIDNRTSINAIKDFAKLLTIENVRDIRIMRDQNATAIYGSRASCGVLVFDLTNKRNEKKLKKIKFE